MALLEKRRYSEGRFSSDNLFNQVYPTEIQQLARRHWTPVEVAEKAANFLAANDGVKVLDIGSGVGKFCLTAAFYKPRVHFIGIEQRGSLVNHANTAKEILRLENVSFINGNFTQIDLRDYDHFYFYNSFYENLDCSTKIDESIEYSGELYNYYNRYLYKQLEHMPAGTRLAAFHSLEDEMPPGYQLVGIEMGKLLKFWIKV